MPAGRLVVVFLALREMRRSPGRFGLLTGAVALLVVLLLFFQAVAGSLTTGLTGALDNNEADVVVYSDRARRNPAASFLPAQTEGLVMMVAGVDRAAAVGRGSFATDAGLDPDAVEDVVVVGLTDPGFGGPEELDDGRGARARGEAVLGSASLATSYDLGEVVRIEGIELSIVGIARDASFDVSPTLYVLFADYEALTRSRAGAMVEAPVSWIAVAASDGISSEVLAERITEDVAGVDALDRATAAGELPGVGQVTRSFSILYLLLFIVVTIVTGVFFLILTVQKQQSLVLLRAMGANRSDIAAPVLFEVVTVVGLGAATGVMAAGALLWAARDTFGSDLDPRTTLLTVGFVVLLGVVASLGAVRRVLAVDPLEATRAEVI
jgi:putative ABC transport system permease protein